MQKKNLIRYEYTSNNLQSGSDNDSDDDSERESGSASDTSMDFDSDGDSGVNFFQAANSEPTALEYLKSTGT